MAPAPRARPCYVGRVTGETEPHRRRLDERVAPGWANLSTNLLRGGGVLLGLLLLWLGLVTGGFFLLLTGVLAVLALVGGWLLGGVVQRESWYERPNAKVISIALVVFFPLALFVFAQVVGPLLTPPPTAEAHFTGALQRGEERLHQLPVDPRLVSMDFRLHITRADGGAVRWFVEDPTGQSRWSGRTDRAGYTDRAHIEVVGGQWTIHVISEADYAEYEIDWAGRTVPPASSPLDAN